MSHEEEVITTGPFDETDEHDYSDHHHHHQPEQENGNGWDNQNDEKQGQNDNGEQPKQEEATRRNLYVSNLSFETTEELLKERFSPFGEIVHIEIVRDPATKQSRGFGFITFALNEQGENAVNTLNGSDINGRPLRVEHARRSIGHVKTPGRYLGPRGGSSRYNDRSDRRGGGGDRRYDDYHNSGPPRGRRSNSRDRDRRPAYRERSRSRERVPYDRGWGGDNRYPDSRGPPPSDRWGGPPDRRSRSRDRGGPPRPSYGGYDNRRDRR